MKIAAAPISWGICDVPGWGHQMPYERVLEEMQRLGITATEVGPAGFLPARPEEARAVLAQRGLRPVGTYLDLVLHDPEVEWRATFEQTLDFVAAVGGDAIVLAVLAAPKDYSGNPGLDDDEWTRLFANLDAAHRRAGARGITLALHPHLGTLIEKPVEIARVLDSSGIGICLDTGHAHVGGSDPVELVARAAHRLEIVHLKDVDDRLAREVRAGRVDFLSAVEQGLFKPLTEGSLDVQAIFHELRAQDFDGWIVLEQDTMLKSSPDRNAGPLNDVLTSLAAVRREMAMIAGPAS